MATSARCLSTSQWGTAGHRCTIPRRPVCQQLQGGGGEAPTGFPADLGREPGHGPELPCRVPSPPTSPGRSLENLARESVPKLALSTLLWGQVLLVPQGATTCYVTLLFPGSSSQPLPLTLKTLTGFVAPRKALVQVIPRQRRFTAGVRRLCLGAGSRLRCRLKAKIGLVAVVLLFSVFPPK